MTAHSDCSVDTPQKFSNLVDLLRYRAVHQPNQLAFTFLQDGEIEAGSLTYQELDLKAQVIAAHLQSIGVSKERSLLLYPPGLEFIAAFFGCLYAQVVAVPVYPPRRNQKLSRIQAIAADAQAKVALTTESVLADIDRRWAENPDLSKLRWIATDSMDLAQETSWVPLAVTEETLAFLQYTSGSTGTPKGVMVSHGNLLRNSADLDLGWEHTSDSVIVTWLPTFHDMGLIYGMLQPLYKGCSCYMMAPMSFLQKPIRWLQAISRYRGTHSGAPNFAYELCVGKTTPEQQAQLDLSSWRMALNGAEPVRVDVLEKFAEAFKPSGFDRRAFCPGYGLAEATLKASAVRAKDMPVYCHVCSDALKQHRIVEVSADHLGGQTLVGCGWTEIDTEIVIVNPQTCTKCAPDEVGEIWVSGSTIAQGYWQRPEATEETFQAYLADSGEGPFLRTGDLGFVRHGELYVTGRIKDVLIVRGRNHYPQDIELTVEKSHPAFRSNCGAAFSVEVEGEERLVIAQEVERSYLHKLDVDEVVRAIRRAVSEQHELQVYGVVLLKTGSIPKTSSGKIQRRACRVGFLEKHLSVVGGWKLGIEETEKSQTGSEPLGQEINLHNSLNGTIRRAQNFINTSIAAHSANRDAASRTRADNLSGWLRSCANDRIGDLEQTLAGENHSLDELLQRQTWAVSVQSEPNLTEAVPEQRQNGHRQPAESSNPTVETIQDWIENWLAKKLRIATGSVNADTSFADYGIDSVMAVELAQNLGDWLKHPIEATILWNFPTIKSLAQYLAGKTKIAEPEESVKACDQVPFGADEPSETPVEASIAQELAKLENLLGK